MRLKLVAPACYRLLIIMVVAATACDPGVRTEYRIRTKGSRMDSATAEAIGVARRLSSRYGVRPSSASTGTCRLLSATGSDLLEGRSMMLRVCADRLDSSQLRILVLEGFTKEWGPTGDSLRHELRDSLSRVFGSAFSVP